MSFFFDLDVAKTFFRHLWIVRVVTLKPTANCSIGESETNFVNSVSNRRNSVMSIIVLPLAFLLLSLAVREPQTPKSCVRTAQRAQAARIGHVLQIFLAWRIPLRVSPSKMLGSWPIHLASLKNPGSSSSSIMDSGVGVKLG